MSVMHDLERPLNDLKEIKSLLSAGANIGAMNLIEKKSKNMRRILTLLRLISIVTTLRNMVKGQRILNNLAGCHLLRNMIVLLT